MYSYENKHGTITLDWEIVKQEASAIIKKIYKQKFLDFRIEEKNNQEYLFILKYQNNFNSTFLDDTRFLASKIERSIERSLKMERAVVVIEMVPQ